jgi:hypothetical protein
MKPRHLVFACAGAMLLLGTMFVNGLAQSHVGVPLSVTIEGGAPLSTTVTFESSMIVSDGKRLGLLNVTVLDPRGLASGWSVVVETQGHFRPEEPVLEHSGELASALVVVRQGNGELGGHSIVLFGTVAPVDSLRWSAARSFGDGEYVLSLVGAVRAPAEGAGQLTLYVTLSGSAP